MEACQAWLEHITHQMDVMNYTEQVKFLAGPLALLKYQVTSPPAPSRPFAPIARPAAFARPAFAPPPPQPAGKGRGFVKVPRFVCLGPPNQCAGNAGAGGVCLAQLWCAQAGERMFAMS